jgi:hypothetical protein
MRTYSHWHRALAVGLVALAVRLIYILVAGRHVAIEPGTDAVSYDTFARLMMSGWSWITTPLAVREPLYPAFMAVAYAMPGGDIGVLQVLQALIGAAGVVTVYLTLRVLIGESVAMLSAIFIALNPHFVYWTALPLRENLIIPLLIGFLMVFLLAMAKRRMLLLFLCALLFVLLVHTDVRFLILAAVFPLMIYVYHHDLKTTARQTLWIWLFTILLMIPYQVRAYVAMGKPVIVTERFLGKWLQRSAAVMSDGGGSEAGNKRLTWLHEWEITKEQKLDQLPAYERHYYLSGGRPAIGRLQVHWILLVEYWRCARFKPMYRPYPDGRFEPPWSLKHNVVSSIVIVPFLLVLPVVFTRFSRAARRIAWPLLLFLLGSTLMHVFVHARERYRIPLEVITCIVLAMALVTLWNDPRRAPTVREVE